MKASITTEVEINNLKGLIVKKALESWRKFPPKTRCYIELEDMIQDGAMIVHKLLVQGVYNKKRATKLSSYVWIRLEGYYTKCAAALNTQKRFDGFDLLIEDMMEQGHDIASEEESEISTHVRDVFLATYEDASEELRESMRRWFLATETTKVHTKGVRFVRDRSEFRKLAQKNGFDVQDCRLVMHSTQVRNEIVQMLPEHNYLELV